MNTENGPRSQTADLAVVSTVGATGFLARLRAHWWLLLVAALLALAVAAVMVLRLGRPSGPTYRVVNVTRGDLNVQVTATGTLQPINQVEVGSEVSGTVESVLVDVNDRVARGQVLARLDTSRLHDQLVQSEAALDAAKAQVAQSQATVTEARLQYSRLTRMATLSQGRVPSKLDLDTAKAALQRAEAALAVARAGVDQAQAAVRSNDTSLSKATIRSPINGVVLVRSVEPGQTVAASLQAPVLFTLAEDLTQMELDVDVDEADVAQVADAQSATFTVDAWPGRVFPARVKRVSFGSQTKDGVVSYLTVLNVNNADLSLRPGMTATAEIRVAERRNVLLVPNAALRFAPVAPQPAPSSGGFLGRLMPHPPHPISARATSVKGAERPIWVLRDGQPVELVVTTGASDGRFTEITSGALQPGMAVITEAISGAP